MRPSYTSNDPRGWCGDPKRGAALGRSTITGEYDGSKLTLRHIRLDNGGYDVNGTYFGFRHGLQGRLYWCADDSGEIDFMLRASDRADARRQVRENYPNVRFFN